MEWGLCGIDAEEAKQAGRRGPGLGQGPHKPGQQPPQAREQRGAQGRGGAAKVTARQASHQPGRPSEESPLRRARAPAASSPSLPLAGGRGSGRVSRPALPLAAETLRENGNRGPGWPAPPGAGAPAFRHRPPPKTNRAAPSAPSGLANDL